MSVVRREKICVRTSWNKEGLQVDTTVRPCSDEGARESIGMGLRELDKCEGYRGR